MFRHVLGREFDSEIEIFNPISISHLESMSWARSCYGLLGLEGALVVPIV
jgi:hypothetical protein